MPQSFSAPIESHTWENVVMSTKKVLIVEDDHDVRLGYHVLLKANHYETYLAADGVSAISEALKHRPDLTILDIGLPGGDGFTVLECFRTSTYLSALPVIVVSGRELHGTRDRALKAGAKAYLQKPWNDYELLATIRRLLGESDVTATRPKWDH
jgi:chemosensory pili system protein ChpA (sensor histidine kinase/response regulator)